MDFSCAPFLVLWLFHIHKEELTKKNWDIWVAEIMLPCGQLLSTPSSWNHLNILMLWWASFPSLFQVIKILFLPYNSQHSCFLSWVVICVKTLVLLGKKHSLWCTLPLPSPCPPTHPTPPQSLYFKPNNCKSHTTFPKERTGNESRKFEPSVWLDYPPFCLQHWSLALQSLKKLKTWVRTSLWST